MLCESRGGRPGLPDPNGPYGLCGRTATLNTEASRSYKRWPATLGENTALCDLPTDQEFCRSALSAWFP